MLVLKKIKRNDDGTFESTFVLSPEQVGFLMSFAVNELVAAGVVELVEKAEDLVDENEVQSFYIEGSDELQ